MKEKNIILIRYSLWFLGSGIAFLLSASDKMQAFAIPIFALSSLLLYRKRVFTTKVKFTGVVISIFIVSILVITALFGWNVKMNNTWEQFVYRSHVLALVWLALTILGVFLLKKELREYQNKINETITAGR